VSAAGVWLTVYAIFMVDLMILFAAMCVKVWMLRRRAGR
jgi:hypothetical protein